ncbi:hypothetical protein ACGFX4_19980 [Kitasatospora sp. NPDC048365]|uniref:hypothetical protein n=1 Tax=Kitasatospora sp. NPDC048365 TaxID=3364050 RepID=UPI0037137B2E
MNSPEIRTPQETAVALSPHLPSGVRIARLDCGCLQLSGPLPAGETERSAATTILLESANRLSVHDRRHGGVSEFSFEATWPSPSGCPMETPTQAVPPGRGAETLDAARHLGCSLTSRSSCPMDLATGLFAAIRASGITPGAPRVAARVSDRLARILNTAANTRN